MLVRSRPATTIGMKAPMMQSSMAVSALAGLGQVGQEMKWGLVTRNVATLVEPPRVPRHEMRFLSPAGARTLLAAAGRERLEALYTVDLALGLRQGESLGLRWEDVDFAANTLRIRYARQRVDGALQLVEPKTSQSRRTLIMPPRSPPPSRRTASDKSWSEPPATAG